MNLIRNDGDLVKTRSRDLIFLSRVAQEIASVCYPVERREAAV